MSPVVTQMAVVAILHCGNIIIPHANANGEDLQLDAVDRKPVFLLYVT